MILKHYIRSPLTILGVICLLALVLRLLAWWFEPTISRDGLLYIQLAQAWYETGNCTPAVSSMFPLLPIYMIKMIMYSGLPVETAGLLLTISCGTLQPLVMYGIAKEVTRQEKLALASALLVAVSPTMIGLSIEIQRDICYLLFCGLQIYFIIRGIRKKSLLCFGLSGIMLGFSISSRYEAAEMFPIVIFALLFLSITKYISWKKFTLCGSVFCIGFIFVTYGFIVLMQKQEYYISALRFLLSPMVRQIGINIDLIGTK